MIAFDISDRARRDLAGQIDWLADKSPRAAQRASEKLFDAITLIASFPEMGVTTTKGLREHLVKFGRDGYVVRYRVEEARVLIVRVFHTRQQR